MSGMLLLLIVAVAILAACWHPETRKAGLVGIGVLAGFAVISLLFYMNIKREAAREYQVHRAEIAAQADWSEDHGPGPRTHAARDSHTSRTAVGRTPLVLSWAAILIVGLAVVFVVAGAWHSRSRTALAAVMGVVALLVIVLALGWWVAAPMPEGVAYEESSSPTTALRVGQTIDLVVEDDPLETATDEAAKEGTADALTPDAASDDTTDATPVASKPPAWVNETPKRVGSVYRTKVVSDPYPTKEECDRSLDGPIRQAAAGYIDDMLGEDAYQKVSRVLDLNYLLREVCVDEFTERYRTQTGFYVYRVHVLMEFDPETRATIRETFRQVVLQDRLKQVGTVAVLVLGLLGVVFGYFTLDTATKGFYTGKLQVAAAVAIIGGLLAAAALFS